MNSNQEKPAAGRDSSNKSLAKGTDKLEQRLEKLEASLEEHHQDEGKQTRGLSDNSGMAYGLKLGSEFVAAILVGSAIGWVIDQWTGSTPFGLIFFLILGFAAGVLNVMRAAGKIAEPGS